MAVETINNTTLEQVESDTVRMTCDKAQKIVNSVATYTFGDIKSRLLPGVKIISPTIGQKAKKEVKEAIETLAAAKNISPEAFIEQYQDRVELVLFGRLKILLKKPSTNVSVISKNEHDLKTEEGA